MKKLIYVLLGASLLSSCNIYSNYHRPQELPTDSLYRDYVAGPQADTSSLGDLPWQDVFTDDSLRELIRYGLENNTDLQVALLRVDQAKASLKAARLAFIPSFAVAPQGGVQSIDLGKATFTYEIPLQASWEIDLFGKLRNAKKSAQATLLQQQAYRQAVQSEVIAGIATGYYSLLMLDEQVDISRRNLDIWQEQVRTLEARFKVGEGTENAVTQARANFYELQVVHNDLQRRQREAENALCSLLGMPSQTIGRGTLAAQTLPDTLSTGVPLRLLSRRPDVVQAEMTLAAAYYNTNQARSAFYPNLTLSGSAGWTNALGQVVSNPGGLILSALGTLLQPIFQRGKLMSNLRISKDEEQIAKLNYRQALLDAGQEVNDALYATQSHRRNLDSHEQQRQELERTVKTSESLYLTDNATYLELLTARQSLLNAELNVASDRFSCLQSIITLYNALGGGRE